MPKVKNGRQDGGQNVYVQYGSAYYYHTTLPTEKIIAIVEGKLRKLLASMT